MTVFIPSKATKKYSASNQSDLFGNLVRTRNLDFDKKGYLSLARKPMVLANETLDADFQVPICIASDDSTVYVVTSDHFFTIDATGTDTSINEKTAGTPPNFSFNSDYAFYTEDIHVSGTTTIGSYDLSGNTWTERVTGLSSSYPHPLCVSEHQQYLAVGNGNTVRLYDSGYNLITTCTVPAAQIVTWIRWKGNLLYFGTRNIFGGEARMYVWNGSGTAAQAGYGVGCEWTMSACEYEDTLVVVCQNGRLLRFSGNGFVPLRADDGTEVNFPVYNAGLSWGSGASTSNLLGKVASRGMLADGRRIYIFVDSTIDTSQGRTPSYLVDFPSGLYCFDPAIGLYHKAGVDHALPSLQQASSVASDIITIPNPVVYETGDPVLYRGNALTGDIITNMTYYAIKVTSTTFKLANTPQQALAGQNIAVSGTPNSFDTFTFNVYKNVGATRVNRGGPVHIMSRLTMPRFRGSKILYGCDSDTGSGTGVASVMSLGMGKNVGSFVTPKIQAENATDLFKKLIAKFPPLNIPSRKIILKYRIANRWGMPGRGDFNGGEAVWINSTSFTINPKTYDMYSAAVGDEIEFQSKAAAGYTAHISAITVNSATDWTITIDEAMPDVTASEQSEFIVDNWTKYKTVSTTDALKEATKGLINAALAKNAKWIQLKVELRGYADIEDTVDLEEVMLLTGADQKYA